jgi:hypothetical protein
VRLVSLLCVLGLIGLSRAAGAQDPSDGELLRKAEAAFGRGVAQRASPEKARPDFGEAARCYELLRRRGADNPDLYRNAGNAHLLAGELPEAILAYRRGLRCAPHDADLYESLKHARDQVHYGPEPRARPTGSPWLTWLPRIDRGYFLLAAFLLYALACVSVTRSLMVPNGGGGLNRAVLLLALAVAAAGVWTFVTARAAHEGSSPLVVIARDGVALSRGNGRSYPPNEQLPELHRGMEGRLLHRRGGWLQVEFPGGAVGWVPQAVAIVDEP